MRRAKAAALELSLALYPMESLRAAAEALSARTRVSLRELKDGRCRATLSRPELAGEFLNEALSQHLRRLVEGLTLPALAPVLDAALERGLAAAEDHVERMEPRVREDRRRETEGLLQEARRRGAA